MRRGDDASEFKRQSMNAIKRRTILKKVTFISMMIIAFFMAIAVVLALYYRMNMLYINMK